MRDSRCTDGKDTRPLEARLIDLAAKWRAQARHPNRQFRPEESALLNKHADELLAELYAERKRDDGQG